MAFAAFGSSAPAREPAPQRRGLIVLALLLPGILYLCVFFLVPLVYLLITSLQQLDPNTGQYVAGFQLSNYTDSLGQYWPQLLRAFLYALLATVFALLVSYPLAYLIGVRMRRVPMLQALAVALVIAPFFISFLLRTLAWKHIFADEGPVVAVLHGLSILGPSQYINGSPFAVVFGLTYNFIPFMTLPLFASLERLDLRFLEAANDLYASPARSFWAVTVPLSAPGIVSGSLLTFIPASGDYVNASSAFLGSTQTAMIGNVIDQNFIVNPGPAAALSIALMVVILVIVGIYIRVSGTEDLV